MAGPGAPKTGGRQKGTPNKISADVRAMVLAALDRAGGEDYLLSQAHDNPKAFLSLVGRILPTQITGPGDKDLIPGPQSDPQLVAQAVMLLIEGAAASGTATELQLPHARTRIEDASGEGDEAGATHEKPKAERDLRSSNYESSPVLRGAAVS